MIGAITSLLGQRNVNIAQQARAHARAQHMHARTRRAGTGTHTRAHARTGTRHAAPSTSTPAAGGGADQHLAISPLCLRCISAISPQINTSRGDIAYNVVDISDAEGADGAEATLAALHGLEGVLSTRLIWTGSADAGPSHFQVSNENKDNIAAKLLQQRFMSDM